MLVVVLLGPAGGNCQAASTKFHGGIFFSFSNLHFLFYVPCVFSFFLFYNILGQDVKGLISLYDINC